MANGDESSTLWAARKRCGLREAPCGLAELDGQLLRLRGYECEDECLRRLVVTEGGSVSVCRGTNGASWQPVMAICLSR